MEQILKFFVCFLCCVFISLIGNIIKKVLSKDTGEKKKNWKLR